MKIPLHRAGHRSEVFRLNRTTILIGVVVVLHELRHNFGLLWHLTHEADVSAESSGPGSNQQTKQLEVFSIGTNGTEKGVDSTSWNIVQHGPKRTGTTFQFQILCASLFIKVYDEGYQSGDMTAVENMKCGYAKSGTNHRFDPDKPEVVKFHLMKQFPYKMKSRNLWLFTTTRRNASDVFKELKDQGFNIKYVQDQERLGMLGYSMVYEYKKIFGLNQRQSEKVAEYMRYFEILRQCCGAQMSMDWAEELRAGERGLPKDYKLRHPVHSPSYSACQMYDIGEVERLFMNTPLARAMSSYPKVQGNAVSNLDPPFDGTYCQRYNRAVREEGLKFNDPLPGEAEGSTGSNEKNIKS